MKDLLIGMVVGVVTGYVLIKRQRIRQMKRLPARKILLAAVQLQRQKKKR